MALRLDTLRARLATRPTLLPLLFLGAVATFFIVAYLINPAAVRFGLTGTLPIQLTGGSAGSADTSVSSVFMDSEWKTSSASVAVDPKGGMHMAFYYYEPQAGEAPTGAGYQFCARNCENGANWRGVRIGEAVNEVQLALTPAGKPRVLYRATSEGGLGDDFFYAACERNCTNAAGWTSTKLFSSAGTELFDIYDDDNPQRSFALDPEGRPRFIYTDRNYSIEPDHYGVFYAYCDADCTAHTPENPTWFQAQIGLSGEYDAEIFDYPSLTFTSEGQPRVVANAYVLEGENGIYYFACDGDCGDSANWQRAFLFERGQGSSVGWDIALDARNRPRIAFYQGSLESEGGDQLYYAWCDEACLDGENWERALVGLPEQDGQAPDLELDGRGRPRIAYVEWIGSLGYAWCDRGCESERGGWESVTVESSEALQQLWPIAHPTHCDAGLWNALTPTLALDRRGNPRIAYDATYHARCWYDDELDTWEPSSTFHLMWRVARGVSFSQPS